MSLPFSSSNPVRRFNAASQRAIEQLGWQGLLNASRDASEVVSVVKDHIAQLSPEELARLPEHVRPRRLVDADDVSSYAFLLARQQHLGESCDVLDKLARFVTNAAQRLSQVLFRPRNSRAGDAEAA